MSQITGSQGISGLAPVSIETTAGTAPDASGFGRLLEEVNTVLQRADRLASGYAEGKVGLTDAVLAAEHADTTFGLVMAVRNRALAAYQEIMNMPV